MTRKTVVVSSTARDLKDHRERIRDAIWRQGLYPEMMERLAAGSEGMIADSRRLVQAADIYLGVFADRYGTVPDGHAISITEMEYNWAEERAIPRLLFLAAPDHPQILQDPEPHPEAAERLQAFKSRMLADQRNVVVFFNGPADLWGKVIQSLTRFANQTIPQSAAGSAAPNPPEVYVAHRYLLMQSGRLVGRRTELQELTRWVSDQGDPRYGARVLSVVAVGGTGKSALTWAWFQEIAPRTMIPLAGRIWWSFYEEDAGFTMFLARTLAYVSRRPFAETTELSVDEQIRQLVEILDREPFLIVLDGLERMLVAYNRIDAARLNDEELDDQTAQFPLLLPAGADAPLSDRRRLRKVVDERFGRLLRELAGVRQSRILISTRLSPADLQVDGIRDRRGSATLLLPGLKDADALGLWKSCGGQVSELVPATLRSTGHHALAIQILASTVAADSRAAGDFEQWCRLNPGFNPGGLPLIQVKSHILRFALEGLSEAQSRTLQVLAAFRAPTTFDTLSAIQVRDGGTCTTDLELHAVLKDLEDRGLVGWDRPTNRYDLHPIVRSVVYESSRPADRKSTYALLERHFSAYPRLADQEVTGLQSLNPALELFHALINQDRFDEAHRLFFDRLATPLLRWLDAHRLRVQLLESLFPPGAQTLPRLSRAEDQAQALNALSLAYRLSGQPGPAATLSRLDVELLDREGKGRDDLGNGRGKLLGRALRNLALALTLTGELKEAEAAATRAIVVDRDSTDPYASYWEALDLGWLAWIIARTGRVDAAQRCLKRGQRIMTHHDKPLSRARFALTSARVSFWSGDFAAARADLARARELQAGAGNREKTDTGSPEREGLLIERLGAQFLLEDGKVQEAERILFHLLSQVRGLQLIHEEVDLRILLAELHRRQGRLEEAEELLGEAWSWVEFGPYRLFHADARVVESRIHQARGQRDAAIEAARRAEELAWCDGAGHWYYWGLLAARSQLQNLGVNARPTAELHVSAPVHVDIEPRDQFYDDSGTEWV